MTLPEPRPALHRCTRGAVYVEFLVAFIPVMTFFFGLLQLALIFTAQLVVRHAAARAVRSAIVVLDDDPARYDGEERGEVAYSEGSGGSGRTAQFIEQAADLLGLRLPMNEVSGMLDSHASQRLSVIQQAAYMPLAVLAPMPATLFKAFGAQVSALDAAGNGGRFLMGVFLYNRAAAMVTLRNPETGEVAYEADSMGEVTIRVSYFYYCSMPIASYFMCDSLLELAGLDRLGGAARDYYEAVAQQGAQGIETIQASRGLATAEAAQGVVDGVQTATTDFQSDLQAISDQVGALARDLQYAESPELLLPFAFSRARFKLLSAEASLPNQGACYYVGSSCFSTEQQ